MSLERYLDDVIAPFPPDTARRIRLDLEEHALAHADALRGARHPDPETAALAALGPMREVRRALERAHYTSAEEEALWANRAYRKAEVRSLGRILLETLFGLALPFLAALLPGWDNGFAWWGYAAYATGVLLLAWVEWTIPRRLSPRSVRVMLGLLRGSSALFIIPALYLIWYGESPDLWFTLSSVICGAGIAYFFWIRPLWAYLPKALRNAR